MKIFNLGSLNIDYVYSVERFVAPGETMSSNDMQIFPGGKGLNQSIALALAGAEVYHGAILGSGGEFLLETMKKSGVRTDYIKKSDGPSGHAIIQVESSGQNCILLFAGQNRAIDKSYVEEFLSDACENDILLTQNETSGLKEAFETAHSKKMQIAFNPSPYDESVKTLPLSYVKWWFCNEVEGEALFGSSEPKEILKSFIERYPESNLILTLGKNGSFFKNAKQELYRPIFETQAVDTTAAGDTFTGYFLNAAANGRDYSYALKIASKASSIAVSRKGASVSIPVSHEVIL